MRDLLEEGREINRVSCIEGCMLEYWSFHKFFSLDHVTREILWHSKSSLYYRMHILVMIVREDGDPRKCSGLWYD